MNKYHIGIILLLQLWFPYVFAQNYPSAPLTIIVPFAPGGGTDIIGRILADQLSKQISQRVIVDNRGGAGTVIGTNAVAKAKPDGLTVLINGASMAFFPALFKNLPFDPARDLRIVSLVSEQPYVLTVNSSFRPRNLKEFSALALARPNEIGYASAGIGSGTHLASELLWQELGIKLLHVPYKGTAPAVTDLLSGYVQVMYTTAAGAGQMIKAGRVRALAVSSTQRLDSLPNVPTISEAGAKGFRQVSWIAMFVPTGVPEPILERLHVATASALRSSELAEKYDSQGLQAVHSKSLEEASKFLEGERKRWAGVIRNIGITPQ